MRKTPEGWSRARPSSGGRWLWREDGSRHEVELTLTADGRAVAECGDAAEGTPQFYWELTSTSQQQMPGSWKRVEPQEAKAEPVQVQPLSDEQIVGVRDDCLPSQGERFDCIAFARAIERAFCEANGLLLTGGKG